jgi:MoaA/NifB/PqqE/SkfB family radical SAM enzyme
MPDFIASPQKLIDNDLFRCLVSTSLILEIKYNGEVTLCSHAHFIDEKGNLKQIPPLGNVKYDRLMELWRSNKCFIIQKYLRSKKNKCICWCEGNDLNTDLIGFWNNFEMSKRSRI